MILTPTQSRMARAALGLSINDLAAAAGVRAMTVSGFERGGNCYASTVAKLRQALEDRGAVFISSGEVSLAGGEGVRMQGTARHSNQGRCRSFSAAVPRFYFNLYNDIVSVDDEGREFPDVAAARSEAERSAREIASAEVLTGRLVLRHYIEVLDERGDLVATVCFGDVIEVDP